MISSRIAFLLGAVCLAGCAAPPPGPFAVAGTQPGFTAFGEDEEACRHAGEAAINAGASDANAAHQYDYAYQRCMFDHGQARQRAYWTNNTQDNGPYPRENLHSFEYPDAFYSIPYATPGYGYDGFSR
jgi:hypothetical protein